MTNTYKIELRGVRVRGDKAALFQVAFDHPTESNQICKDANAHMEAIMWDADGALRGSLALLSGVTSPSEAIVLASHLHYLFATIAIFDPKMEGYVVAADKGGGYNIGDVIAADKVQPQ